MQLLFTFDSDHLMPSTRVLHGRSSLPDVMLWIVTQHRIRKVTVREATGNIHLKWSSMLCSNLSKNDSLYRGEQHRHDHKWRVGWRRRTSIYTHFNCFQSSSLSGLPVLLDAIAFDRTETTD